MAVAAATQAVIEHVANVQRLQGAIAALHKVFLYFCILFIPYIYIYMARCK